MGRFRGPSRKVQMISAISFVAALFTSIAIYALKHSPAVLDTAGTISGRQRNLIIFATLLSLIVVIPVFVMTIYISVKYREGNRSTKYQPEWDHDRKIEAIWWGVPLLLITVLSVVTWQTSKSLDPFKELDSAKKPIVIQVVALNWKWLFIYPKEKFATVNVVTFPVDRPVKFEITSDAPMNSFWIPKLAGQIYAMNGMSSELNIIATKPGVYIGRSANISGEGFSGMQFTATAFSSDQEFDNFVHTARSVAATLNGSTYDDLAKPTKNVTPYVYGYAEANLYNNVLTKYLLP